MTVFREMIIHFIILIFMCYFHVFFMCGRNEYLGRHEILNKLVKVFVAQSYSTFCDPVDCNPPGSSVHGILQQECWSGLPFPSPKYLPDSGVEPGSPSLQENSLQFEPPGTPITGD